MMKCDPRAFARCPYKKECSDSPEHASFYEGTECDCFNQQVIHAPLTNGDRIRAMRDEELAEHIWKKFGCPEGKDHVTCGYVGECKDCWIEWLQQTAEEDT